MTANLDTKAEHGTETMKSVPYLKLSEDGVYYYRRRVPTALIPYFNKITVKQSLNTKDFKQARLLRDEINHFYQSQFDEKEKLLSKKSTASISPDLKTNLIEFVLTESNQKQLGKTFLRQVLNSDEDIRLVYGEGSEFINESYRNSISLGSSFKIKSEAIRTYKNIELFYDFAYFIAANAGIDFNNLTDTEKKKLTREYLIREQEAGKFIAERDNSTWIETDTAVKLDEVYKPSKTNWQATYELWEYSSNKRAESIKGYKREFDLFKTFVKNKPIDTVNYEDALAYQQSLVIENKITNTTIKKRISYLKTIFSKSYRNHILDINAFDIEIVKRKKNGKDRFSFDQADLTSIFTSPIYSLGERKLGCGGEASVWIPILAYALGARQEEICQLRVANLKKRNDIYYLEIKEHDEEGNVVSQLKNENSTRDVPLHNDLIEAGFVKFVQAQNDTFIFNKLSLRESSTKRSVNWGKWFMRYLRDTIGITNRKKVFHSFRHTFTDLCKNNRVSLDARKALIGHKEEGMDAVYGERPDLETLNEEIQKIKFPFPIPKLID